VLEYRYDANQILELKLALAPKAGTGSYECTVENPLTNVVNPQAARLKLDELEEEIRTGKVPKESVSGKLVEAAELMAELGHRERAFAQLKKVLQGMSRPSGWMLNRMGILAGEMGDAERRRSCTTRLLPRTPARARRFSTWRCRYGAGAITRAQWRRLSRR
jgi:hypothetical protein